MTKIKLCGMFRERDIEYANEAMPDYIGFILNFPKSRRNIDLDTAEKLSSGLDKRITAVGVFVDSEQEYIREAVDRGIIKAVQLHGSEDAEYIKSLRRSIGEVPVIKAVKVNSFADIEHAKTLGADYLLLDSGTGTGKSFDHSVLLGKNVGVPFFIAGGLTPESIPKVIRLTKPYAVDLSSGIETDGVKDREKMKAAVKAAMTDYR